MGGDTSLLYGQPLSTLKWGISPGSHVAHIVTSAESNPTVIKTDREPEIEISQSDVYNNAADNATKEYFKNLVHESSADFEADYADEQFRDYLYTIRDYVTASSRNKQQSFLKSIRDQQNKYIATLNKRIESASDNPTEEESRELELNRKRLERISSYADEFVRRAEGNLEVPEEENAKLMSTPVTNPKKRYHLGFWVKDDGPLFPHEPSPADIKQGYGVQDCFMLSALSGVAAKNPQAIKDSMKDNHDGTVTVRFYNKKNNNAPVFIRVEKSANKLAGMSNMYASSSLWVQMMEKAYVKFVNEYVAPTKFHAVEREMLKDGYNAINRSTTDEFMNAFGKEEYKPAGLDIGSGNTPTLYKMDSNGNLINHPPGYMREENEYFDFLSQQVKDPKAVITVGIIETANNKAKIDFAKSKGLRSGHAYTMLNTFEKVVDGEKKKFVTLRDPYATFSVGYDKDGNMKNTSSIIEGTRKAGTDNMGTFNLEYKDFLKTFANVIGVPRNAADDFKINHITKWRDYDAKPLTAAEKQIDYREMVNTAPAEEAKPETSKEAVQHTEPDNSPVNNEAVPRTEKTDPDESRRATDNIARNLVHMLETPEGLNKMLKNLNSICEDLKSTDEWFVWTNTNEFNNMRDKAYALNRTLTDMCKDGQTPSLEALKRLAPKIIDCGISAKDYAENKAKSISDNRAKGKDPSLRAKHRLSSAIDLFNVCSAQEPSKALANKGAENVNIVLNDLNERVNMNEQGLKIPHDNKPIEAAHAELKKVISQIDSDPSIKRNGKISDEAVNKGKKNIAKAAQTAAPKKKEISTSVGDFEIT